MSHSQTDANAENPESIGLIAGDQSLPLIFAKEARKKGVQRIVAAAFEGETNPELTNLVDEIVWMRVGQLSRLISTFSDRKISRCVMAGRIAPKNLYDLRPDLRALSVLVRLKEKNAHTIFGAIADELKKDGVELVEATPWMRDFMPGSGFRLGPGLSHSQQQDVLFGEKIARETSRLEIGQTVVVKDGTILAVEALEGTNICLERGGSLAGRDGGAVAVKLAKPGHDMRFDIPCLGPATIETCIKSGIRVLAFEARRSILLEQEKCADLANRGKVSVVTFG